MPAGPERWLDQTGSFVGNTHDQGVGVGLEGSGNRLGRVVSVAVEDRIDGSLAHRHGDVRDCILVEPGPLSPLLSCLLNLVNTVERRIQGETDTACR